MTDQQNPNNTRYSREIHLETIVGYQNKKTQNVGYNMVTPTFAKIGGGKIDLQEVKLEGAVGDQSEFISVLDANGLAIGTYYWIGEAFGMEPAWYDDSWTPIADVSLEDGQGVFLYTPNAVTITIPFAGEVKMTAHEVALGQGYSIAGNASVVDLDLQALKLEGAVGDQSEFISVLDENGLAIGTYYWIGEAFGMDPAWYDDSWTPIADVTIKAGDAMMISSPNNATTKLVIPAVSLEK